MGSSYSTPRENNFCQFVSEPAWGRYLYEHQLKEESTGNFVACKLVSHVDELERLIDKREECIAIMVRKLVELGVEDFGELFINHPNILAQFNPSILSRVLANEPF